MTPWRCLVIYAVHRSHATNRSRIDPRTQSTLHQSELNMTDIVHEQVQVHMDGVPVLTYIRIAPGLERILTALHHTDEINSPYPRQSRIMLISQ